jgi:hypothetical protein
MAKQPLETEPTTPTPSTESPSDGMTEARSLARRYLPDDVRLLAAIAFGKDTEAGLHTRMLAAKAIVDIAGVIPQATPTAPSYEGAGNGGGQA